MTSMSVSVPNLTSHLVSVVTGVGICVEVAVGRYGGECIVLPAASVTGTPSAVNGVSIPVPSKALFRLVSS